MTLRGLGLARTALHIAVIHNNLPVVAALLEVERVNVNAKDKDGNTPLMLACEKGYEDIALLLISNKLIDVNAQNKDGHTALILSSVKVGGKMKVVEALIGKKTCPVPGTPKSSKSLNTKDHVHAKKATSDNSTKVIFVVETLLFLVKWPK